MSVKRSALDISAQFNFGAATPDEQKAVLAALKAEKEKALTAAIVNRTQLNLIETAARPRNTVLLTTTPNYAEKDYDDTTTSDSDDDDETFSVVALNPAAAAPLDLLMDQSCKLNTLYTKRGGGLAVLQDENRQKLWQQTRKWQRQIERTTGWREEDKSGGGGPAAAQQLLNTRAALEIQHRKIVTFIPFPLPLRRKTKTTKTSAAVVRPITTGFLKHTRNLSSEKEDVGVFALANIAEMRWHPDFKDEWLYFNWDNSKTERLYPEVDYSQLPSALQHLLSVRNS